MHLKTIATRLAGLAAVLGFASAAHAQAYPTQRINLVIPFAAGAATDNFARIIGDGMQRLGGQPVIAVNRPGANYMVAVRSVQQAPADGHTVVILASGILNEQALKRVTDFDIRKDMMAVARASQAPLGMFASNHLPANTVAELVDYVRKNPGKVNFATSGIGSIAHLTTERFRAALGGLNMVHVPYPGGTGPINIALMAGDVQVFVNEMGSMRPLVADKRIKALVTFGEARMPIFPDVPTSAETGVPELRNFLAPFWFGFFVAPGTDPQRVEALATLINNAIAEAATRDKLVNLGYNPALLGGTRPAQFTRIIGEELQRAEAVIRDAKIVLN